MADNKVNSGLLEFSEDQKVFVALDAETSEVKKAVTIDEDGVETDIQGVQPTGKKEITTTEEVNVANYATAQVVDEDLVAGNIKKDVDILGVVGTYEPTAPASDFSTVSITIADNTAGSTDSVYSIPVAYSENEENFSASITPEALDTAQLYTSVLYKGLLFLRVGENIIVSGAATYDSETGSLLITGDCTLKGVTAANL